MTTKIAALSSTNYSVNLLLKEMGYQVVDLKTAEHLDLLVVPGGSDINPSIYGKEAAPQTHAAAVRFDYQELCAIMAAKLRRIPILGICRGAQLLHASNGGYLIQHLEDHRYPANGHKLENYKGDTKIDTAVNSFHHQGIPPEEAHNMYGEKNVLLASSRDCVEVFASHERRTYGVQFHPEYAVNNAYSLLNKSTKEFFMEFFKSVLIETKDIL